MPHTSLRLLALIAVLALPLAAEADCMGPYPPSMVKAFNQNCAKDSQMQGFCSCIIDTVQKNIPLADFIEIGNSTGGINSDPRFIKASKDCSTQLPGAPAASAAPASQAPLASQPAVTHTPVENPSAGGLPPVGTLETPAQR